jgi:riboflavin kinase/FMN adenylyltransferase
VERLIAVGRFDGVHLGHRHLLSSAKEFARKRGWTVLAYTFPPAPPALLPLDAKIRLLRELADEVEVVPWERVKGLSPEEFLAKEVKERLCGRAIWMGPDHRFGRDRAGTPELAQKLGAALGLEVHVVPPFRVGDEVVSSRRIRELLSAGEVERAGELLGRPPTLFGEVVPGLGLARTLGFPTLNLSLDPLLLRPREGVYLGWAFWEGGNAPGLFYHGKRPTFPGLPPSSEVHLFSSPPASPPRFLEVHLLRFLRPDTQFPSKEALVRQIQADAEAAKEALREISPPRPILLGI